MKKTLTIASYLLLASFLCKGQINIDSLIQVAESLEEDTTKWQLLKQISSELEYVDFNKGQEYAAKALVLAYKIGDLDIQGHSEMLRGIYLANSLNVDSAEHHFKKAYKLYKQTNNSEGLIKALGKFLYVAKERGEYDKVFKIGHDILDSIKGKDKLNIEAFVNLDLAHARINQVQYASALEYLNTSDDLMQTMQMEPVRIHTHRLKAFALKELKRYDEALEYLSKAIAINEKYYPGRQDELLFKEQGDILKAQGKHRASLAPLLKALKALESQNNNARGVVILKDLALSHLKLGEDAKARYYLDQLRTKLDTTNTSPELLSGVYFNQGAAFSGINKDSSRYYYRKAFDIMAKSQKDSLDIKTQELITQYNTQQKETEILKLTSENLKSKNRNIILASGLSFFTLLTLLSYFLYNKTKKTNNLLSEKNNLIQLKNEQNETLLKEIHHRVKNNLQTISSLLYLQSSTIQDDDAKEAISEGQHRVESMALIHKNLYQKDNLAAIEMQGYIQKLSDNLSNAYKNKNQSVTIKNSIESIELDVDTAIPLGLIINELLTNAFKYAFQGKPEGEISLSLKKQNADGFIFRLSDNGTGNISSSKGFGTKLISLLTRQLDATITEGNNNGYWCEISKP